MIELKIGETFEFIIEWMTQNLGFIFDTINVIITTFVTAMTDLFLLAHPFLMIVIFAVIAFFTAKRGIAIFTLVGFYIIYTMNLWDKTMETLALVLTSAIVALMIGVPLGILSSKNNTVEKIVRPLLDFMQTMPAFVYLIPAVFFFRLGQVPGVIATLIFSMPPAVRLTNLGIRQVPVNVREAAISFGSTSSQMLFKVELPTAMPTILAGVNQTIMLALSMVVIAAMIGAGGLGEQVLKGLTQLKVGLGFESGIAIVILAIILDRLTQSLGKSKK
ncbi:MAG: glycine/betaine ABC transporter permease [Melioribacteraceae bacterium]|nr:MAG: glycine/betaine ABC transporter permease [Melioribacteraceae bacterium]